MHTSRHEPVADYLSVTAMTATPYRLRRLKAIIAAERGPDFLDQRLAQAGKEGGPELQQQLLDIMCLSWLGPIQPRWPRSDRGAERGPRDWHYQDMTCEVCGGKFTPSRWDALYCSGACRQKAYRRRITPL